MITRLILRLPWFLSAPTLIGGAALLAVAVSIIGGPYFERTYRDDADPLAGLTSSPAPLADVATATVAGSLAPAAGQRADEAAATPTAAGPANVAAVGGDTPATAAVATPTAPPAAAPVAQTVAGAPGVLAQGQLVDGDPGHPASGRARLIRAADGSLVLRFEEFSIVNGPDVYVVLSTDPGRGRASAVAGDALNLGKIKATNGNVNYAIPAGTDLTPFRSVILYCRAFHVVMGAATLEVGP